MIRGIGRLNPSKTVLLLCDLQEKFQPSIQYFNDIVETSSRVLDICKHLDVPYAVTEHYPKGLGRTVSPLKDKIDSAHVFDKTLFSMCTKQVLNHLDKISPNYESAILCGIEAHACILTTCLDLLEAGKEVHVLVDAVSSRSNADRQYAFSRMERSGAFLTTAESIVFQLCKDAKHPKFKEIQKIIKNSSPNTGLSKL